MDREERYQRRMEMKPIDVSKYQWRKKPQKKLYLSSSETTTEESETEDFSKRKIRSLESKPKKPLTKRSKKMRILISSDEEEENSELGFSKERKVLWKPRSLISQKPADDKKGYKFENEKLTKKRRSRIVEKPSETDPIIDPSSISLFNLEVLPNKPPQKRKTKETEVKLTQPLTSNYYVVEEFENERNEPDYDAPMDVNIPVFDYNEQEVVNIEKVNDGYIFKGYLTKEEENNFFSSYKIENVQSPIDDSFLDFLNNDTATEEDLMNDIRISLEMTM